MKLRDFDLHFRYFGDGEKRAANWRAAHIVDAVCIELAKARPYLDAPCTKLNIEAYSDRSEHSAASLAKPAWVVLSIGMTRVSADHGLLAPGRLRRATPYPAFRSYVLDLIAKGVARAARDLDWDASRLVDILERLRHKDPICRFEMGFLSKFDRKAGLYLVVMLDENETEARITVDVRDRDGKLLRSELVASPSPMRPLSPQYFFDARTTVMKDGALIFRDREKKEIGRFIYGVAPTR